METIEVESVRRLVVKPGEIVVVTVPSYASRDYVERVAHAVQERLPEGVDCLVVTENLKLQVLSKADAEAV